MKLFVRSAVRTALIPALLCCASLASAQSSSGSTGAEYPEPLTPVPVVMPDGATDLIAYAGPPAPLPVLRANLETAPTKPLGFKKVPGGIVFGLTGHFTTQELATQFLCSRLQRTGDGWSLVSIDGAALELPTDDASLVGAALDFARSKEIGDWLVDISGSGAVSLSVPLRNTQAGIVATRADLVPQFYMPIFAGGKSLIVDQDVRLKTKDSQLFFEADLEVRFFRPGRDGSNTEIAERVGTVPLHSINDPSQTNPVLIVSSGAGLQKIAADLDHLSTLAGWIGFFRWANTFGVKGLDELREELRQTATPVRTPVRINPEDRVAWITGKNATPPAEIPQWLREHRERELALKNQ